MHAEVRFFSPKTLPDLMFLIVFDWVLLPSLNQSPSWGQNALFRQLFLTHQQAIGLLQTVCENTDY
jgi:hypothetical protein